MDLKKRFFIYIPEHNNFQLLACLIVIGTNRRGRSHIRAIKEKIDWLADASVHLRQSSTRLTDTSNEVAREVGNQASIIEESSASMIQMSGELSPVYFSLCRGLSR